MLCFVVVMQSFIMNSHEVFIHIHQGCFAGTGAIVRLPQCQQSKPGGYRKISQCITTTKHSKAKTVCIFLGIYCNFQTYFLCNCCQQDATELHQKVNIGPGNGLVPPGHIRTNVLDLCRHMASQSHNHNVLTNKPTRVIYFRRHKKYQSWLTVHN